MCKKNNDSDNNNNCICIRAPEIEHFKYRGTRQAEAERTGHTVIICYI